MIGRGPVPLTEIEKDLVRSQVEHYLSDPYRFGSDTYEKRYERLIRDEKDRIRLERDPSSYNYMDVFNELINPKFFFFKDLSIDLVKRWVTGGGVNTVCPSPQDAKAKDYSAVDYKESSDPSSRSYTTRTEQKSPAPYPHRVKVNGSNCIAHNKSSGPGTLGFTKRTEQDLSGVSATIIEQVETKTNQTVDGDRSPQDAKPKDYLGAERNNSTHNKDTQCPGIAHRDPCNVETNDWVLVARRSPKNTKSSDYLDVGHNNRSGSKTRSHTTRIEQEAFDRRSENVRVNAQVTHNKEPQKTYAADAKAKEFLGVELNKENDPMTTSCSERIEQGSLGRSHRYATVKDCDDAAKECAVTVDRSSKDTKAKKPLCVERNKESGPRTRSYYKRMEQGFLVRSPEHAKDGFSYITDDVDILKWILYPSGFKDFFPSARPSTMDPAPWFNYQGRLNRTIEDIDILKRILHSSGFNLSCKDFSPGSVSLPSVHQFYANPTGRSPTLLTLLANYQAGPYRIIDDINILKRSSYFSGLNFSCKDFSPGFAPLLPSTALRRFYTFPTRLNVTLLTLFTSYQNRLNHSIDDINIIKGILRFSGFNFSCKDFSPGPVLFPPSHISLTSDFNFNCNDLSLGFASLLSSISVNQFHTITTWLSVILLTLLSNYLGGFNFKDFHPGPTSILLSIAPQQFHTKGFDFYCKDFSPGHTFPFSRIPPLLLTLYKDFILFGELCLVLQFRKIFTSLNRFTGVINVLMDSLPY